MTDASRANPSANPSANPRANPFWDFSLALYASAAVQKACLDLQDGCGVDVNVLLFALYLAATGRAINEAEASRVAASIEPWRVGVVVPLRTARRNLKEPPAAIEPKGAETLRAIVKKAELEAERLQQAALYAQAEGLGRAAAPGEAARVNIQSYGAALVTTNGGRQLANGPVGVMLAAFEAQLAKS